MVTSQKRPSPINARITRPPTILRAPSLFDAISAWRPGPPPLNEVGAVHQARRARSQTFKGGQPFLMRKVSWQVPQFLVTTPSALPKDAWSTDAAIAASASVPSLANPALKVVMSSQILG